MKLTTKGRYAVQAMADIAARRDDLPVALPDIALRQGISVSYLEQLFNKLRRAGLVDSIRGVAGGYSLARPAAEIRVADIVHSVDEEIRTTACAPGSGIWSTVPVASKGNVVPSYASYNGTSMATPHVTGAAALYAAYHPGATAQQIKTAILGNAVPTASCNGKVSTNGRLNVSSF